MAGITWDQIDNIALSLQEKFPDTDPLTVRFTDLHKWVTELDGFDDDPAASSEG
ncbi:MAG: Fe-S cluster assembly protein IscX, partial [Bryobacteraceae bacterium]